MCVVTLWCWLAEKQRADGRRRVRSASKETNIIPSRWDGWQLINDLTRPRLVLTRTLKSCWRRFRNVNQQSRCIKNKQTKKPPSCCRAPFLHHRGALSCNCRETNHSQLRVSRSLSHQSSEGGRSAADRQAPHGAQVTQQPFDSLFELREAGQRVRRLELAGVVQPGL